MGPQRDAATDRRVRVQGRILEELAEDDAVLSGTLDRLVREFDLAPDELRACLRELVRARWIVVQTFPFGYLTVELERRSPAALPSMARERRRSAPDAWDL
jgi:hypothetical protein